MSPRPLVRLIRHGLVARLLLWGLTLAIFPIPVSALPRSFQVEVLKTSSLVVGMFDAAQECAQGHADQLGVFQTGEPCQSLQDLQVSIGQVDRRFPGQLLQMPARENGCSAQRCEAFELCGKGMATSLPATPPLAYSSAHGADSAEFAVAGELWPKVSASAFSDRVVVRLVEAEFREPDAWYRDDYRIARVTVGLARRGSPIPHIEATFNILGVHPDKVWSRIEEHRRADLGTLYNEFWGEQSSPRKPVQSVKLRAAGRKSKAA
jgi:hypothetical protein